MHILPIHILVLVSGLAALSWQVMWQVKSGLALGVSAWGTALTLAVTMGGMCLGSLVIGHVLKDRSIARPARIFAVLECLIGIAGLCLGAAFAVVERLDTWVWQAASGNFAWVHFTGIILTIGVPTICMGATLPVLGLMARQSNTSLAGLYGFNTLGAAAGALLAAFILIPLFGISGGAVAIAALNLAVGVAAWVATSEKIAAGHSGQKINSPPVGMRAALFTVFATGFATFALEVAWFRSLTAAFRSTTDAFAIMLACVLIALGLGAWLVSYFKKWNLMLGSLTGLAGILIMLATPLVERFDMVVLKMPLSDIFLLPKWFFLTFYVLGPPVLLLGVALPWILEQQDKPRYWGAMYAFNALASVLGALCAAWILLPTIGFAKTAWLSGVLVAAAGVVLSTDTKKRTRLAGYTMLALVIAFAADSGVGRTRAQGWYFGDYQPVSVLEFYEGPDSTVSAVEYSNGQRSLIIDGFTAAHQFGEKEAGTEHYMAWMGHLPMLLHENPKDALVICFGTGQTANAVRRENPASLDIVDINPRVFKLAHNFSKNEGVLEDPRVHAIVMDGRAYMRRTEKKYDIITLEPMPPTFAGVNALYAKEFYELAHARLNPRGVIAQWVPFHILGVHASLSIARTFREVFPDAILWIDPLSGTGILLGSADGQADFGKNWPGFARTPIGRDMSSEQVRQALVLDQKGMGIYTQEGDIITDDNQLLAYGRAVSDWHRYGELDQENIDFLQNVIEKSAK